METTHVFEGGSYTCLGCREIVKRQDGEGDECHCSGLAIPHRVAEFNGQKYHVPTGDFYALGHEWVGTLKTDNGFACGIPV